ncbi:iron-siderophore ABC transporter substrate-binding protein [Bacillus timonensis]|nr:iron-siderophore ABC transporter substrate-binding protein [Bacillus timonensis]
MFNKLNKRFLTALALSLSLTMLLVGCSAEKENSSEGTDKEKVAEEKPYTVEHAMGTTEIPMTPKKVVILTNEGTEALLALGVTPVGAVKSWLGDPWYDHIATQMEGVEVVGLESEVSVETIAALQPDLIIGNKLRQEQIYDQLTAIAPTVFSETLKGNWKENFELYAKALNKEEEGKKVIANFDERIATMKEKIGDELSSEISVVRFMAGKTRIYYTDSFSGVILNQLGFNRPANLEALFADKPDNMFAREVGKEQIPELDGDMIFYFTYETGDGTANQTEEEWTTDALWNNLSAVQAGNVHKVDDAIWNTAGGVLAANLMLDDLEKIYVK